MQTKVVYINKKAMINFGYLPQQFVVTVHGAPCRVMLTNEINWSMEESVFLLNVDLIVECEHSKGVMDNRAAIKPWQLVLNNRHSKLVMAIHLTEIAKSFPKMIAPKTSASRGVDAGLNPFREGTYFRGKCIIKSNNGARGIGQILFDSNVLPIGRIFEVIHGNASKHDKTDKLRSLPTVVYNTDGEHDGDEGLTSLETQGYIIQEFISDVCEEYRLIKTADNKVYVCSRGFYGTDYVQACGVKGVYDKESEIFTVSIESSVLAINHPELIKDILTAAAMVPLEFGSIDLFITMDDRWGFFEYSNEFGASAFYPEHMSVLHARQIAIWLERQPKTIDYPRPLDTRELEARTRVEVPAEKHNAIYSDSPSHSTVCVEESVVSKTHTSSAGSTCT